RLRRDRNFPGDAQRGDVAGRLVPAAVPPRLRAPAAAVHRLDDLRGDGGAVPGDGTAGGDHGSNVLRIAAQGGIPDRRNYHGGLQTWHAGTDDSSTGANFRGTGCRPVIPLTHSPAS